MHDAGRADVKHQGGGRDAANQIKKLELFDRTPVLALPVVAV